MTDYVLRRTERFLGLVSSRSLPLEGGFRMPPDPLSAIEVEVNRNGWTVWEHGADSVGPKRVDEKGRQRVATMTAFLGREVVVLTAVEPLPLPDAAEPSERDEDLSNQEYVDWADREAGW